MCRRRVGVHQTPESTIVSSSSEVWREQGNQIMQVSGTGLNFKSRARDEATGHASHPGLRRHNVDINSQSSSQ